jgi:predicted Fe-S protein YdhL (DUF1289 family)
MTIASPCISLCVIDQTTGLCLGCHRTLAEIAAWGALGDDERRAIMHGLPQRAGEAAAATAAPAIGAP